MTNKSWIYVLDSIGYGRKVLEYAPEGWDKKKVSIKRSPTYKGLIRNLSADLKFVKDGYEYVQNIYEKEGTEFIINIGIYEYNSTLDKYLLFFAGLLDLSSYNVNELYVQCDVNESTLARKLMSRDDVAVNLSKTLSIEDVVLPANNAVTVTLQERKINRIAVYELNDLVTTVTSLPSALTAAVHGFSLPMQKVSSDIDNVVNPSSLIIDQAGSQFWNEGTFPATFEARIKIIGVLGDPIDKKVNLNTYIAFRIYSDNTFTSFIDNIIWSFTGILSPGQPVNIDLNAFFTTINTSQVISFISFNDGNDDEYTSNFSLIDITFSLNQQVETTYANGYLMHEVGERISQVITDKQNAFKSDFFGRTELGYPVDGEGAFQTVHSGKQIRAIPNEFPKINLKDWFQSINSMYNMGLGIEYDEVSQPFLRVEKQAHFFSGEVIVTIHSANEVMKSVAREWIYNEIEVGYAKAEYEAVNGLEEFNNKMSWTNRINTIKNKLNLVSKLRADGNGIEFARQLQYVSNPTEDSKYDNDNFVVIVKKDGSGYKNVQNENYDIVENIFSPETAYNLDITPGRMLRNNGSTIRAGLEHYTNTDLKFQAAEQKENLKSQKTGGSAIVENADIPVNTLNTGLWIPEIYEFKSILTREQLAVITKKSNRIIKFSTTTVENTTKYFYGWILDVQSAVDSEEATWQLLRVNTSSPDIVLIDPEGTPPDIPPPIVDPDSVVGIFENIFPFVFSG